MPFPLKDVQIKNVKEVPLLQDPLYSGDYIQVRHDRCRLEIPGIGVFFMIGGKELWCASGSGIDKEILDTYLNGLPVSVLLHQRGVLHFHAASIVSEGKGIMVLGQSGAGKSSLTAAFHISGAAVLSDDLTAIRVTDGTPCLLPMESPVRLRPDIFTKLNLATELVQGVNPVTGKLTLKPGAYPLGNHLLHQLIYLEKHNGQQFLSDTPAPEEQFSLLRSEICHWEILHGMPGTEQQYFAQILQLLHVTPLVRIRRPENCPVTLLYQFLKSQL